MKIVLLAGGVGGSKLGLGFYRVMNPADLTNVANTGDDVIMHGLHVSPDPDIMMYTLAGLVNPETGWGFKGETFRVAEGLARFGRPTWFQLGDGDLATHIHRTAILSDGATLAEAIASIRTALGVTCAILPMTIWASRQSAFRIPHSALPNFLLTLSSTLMTPRPKCCVISRSWNRVIFR